MAKNLPVDAGDARNGVRFWLGMISWSKEYTLLQHSGWKILWTEESSKGWVKVQWGHKEDMTGASTQQQQAELTVNQSALALDNSETLSVPQE